ncbi:hypothetical protein GOV12_03400 [Candidatus Pacearchaeota archaeon]|nr:hypothetical protein [Candidatus Pacearchaeota archaeon]
MKEIKIPVKDLKCSKSKYNKIEVELLKKRFLNKKLIPSPWINKNNQVIAFYTSFFVLKEIGFKEIGVVLNE